MSLSAALPAQLKKNKGKILTFIVPFGCNMRCSFCFIKQRKEITYNPHLTIDDYANFIISVSSHEDVDAICVQGHEPLLPDSLEYTTKILKTGLDLNIPTSVITNGTYLERCAFTLAQLKPKYLTISLDSANPSIHDELRKFDGAFAAAVRGMKVASDLPVLKGAMAVASVLIPKNRHYLMGMPKLLKEELGIQRWVINPLVKVGSELAGGPVDQKDQIIDDVNALAHEACKYGIEVVLDDELARLSSNGRFEEDNAVLGIERLLNPESLLRLMPDGRCSSGLDILKAVDVSAPCWKPAEEEASSFLERTMIDEYIS